VAVSANGIAVATMTIRLREEADADAFEKRLLTDVFPAVDTSGEGEDRDQHELFSDGETSRDYTWSSRINYDIEHTPTPTWLSQRVQKLVDEATRRVSDAGTVESSGYLFDVATWRARLGT
jgi:hypothetical protein